MSEIARVVLSVTGSDRPGLTSEIADAVLAADGNWQEGQLSQLGGLYVGSVLVEVAPDNLSRLTDAVQTIDADGLTVAIHPALAGRVASEPDSQAGAHLVFELVGQDRPGIIKQVSAALAGLHVNIEALSSGAEHGAWGGEHLFRARVECTLPDSVAPEQVQSALEDISTEIMVDFTFA